MTTNEDKNITPPHSHPLQKWILFGLVFVGVPLSLYFGYLIKGKNQLKKVQQEYKDMGYPVTLQELDDWYPAPVGENAADLYIQAAEQIVNYPDWDPGKEILDAFERQAPMSDYFFDDEEDEEENEQPELEDDKQLIDRVLPYFGYAKRPELGQRIDPASLTLLNSYLQANQQALETLSKALAIKECRYPTDLSKGFDNRFGTYLDLKPV